MSFLTDMVALLAPHFNGGNIYVNTAPDGFTSELPFGILQIVGGTERLYVDQSRPDVMHRRVQIYVWGARALEVEAQQQLVYETLLATIDDPLSNFIAVEPMGGPNGDYNDILKLHGTRQDVGIHWKYPVLP